MNSYSDREIADFLASVRTIAVVGLSDRPERDSYQVAAYLQSQSYELIPVNPNAHMILGRPARKSLQEVTGGVDLVDVFRKPEAVPGIVEEAISIGAKGIWLQLGVTHPVAEAKAREAGLFVISDRCLMVEHRRLLAHSQL